MPVSMLLGSDPPATGSAGDAPPTDAPPTDSADDAPGPCDEGHPGARFVDSEAGDDQADGLAPTSAWRTLARVNTESLQPGDSLCFRAGGSWTGQLTPLGSGAPDAPIVIDRYGSGPLPKIAGGTNDLQVILLVNQQYVEINHLELTNDHAGPGDYRGISVRGRDAGELNHVAIRDCFIHDVTGEVNWIGGSIADDEPPWVKFQTGWDASKRTGGIVFEIESLSGTKTWFNDVAIERNVIQDTSFGGIIFKQLEGDVGWGVRSSLTDASFTPHTNVSIRGNFSSQSGTAYGCNTIYVTGSQNVVIENNVAKDSGTSAIEVYNTDNVLIQHNETFGTVRKAGGADFNGIDTDRASTRTIIQYNYVHDNGDGILLCQFAFGDSIVRYNLIVNNSRDGINLHSDPAATNQTYNNLVYSDLGSGSLVSTSGNGVHLASPYVLSNNLFFTTRTGDAVAAGSGVRYASNLYSGLSPASGDGGARSGDPLFVDPSSRASGGAGGPAFDSLVGFQLRAGSPAIGSGTAITDNGGVDFWNTPLYVGAPDVGPFEAPE
jgi:parallel beta-helix repeat protein